MPNPLSPYITFTPQEWRQYRFDMPLSLSQAELEVLKGFDESLSLVEVADIYLPLARLLHLYITETQTLYQTTRRFLGHHQEKVPYIIGISGSVAVGKSTTSRLLQTLLARLPQTENLDVQLVTTDGFIYPNAFLEQNNLMTRKGFPESYNTEQLIQFLMAVKSGEKSVRVPVYSHEVYDVTDEVQEISAPDILIIEGLNLLNTARIPSQSGPQIFVSDFLDFTIYVDAKTDWIGQWYLKRFMAFRQAALTDPTKYFHRFATLSEAEAVAFAKHIWQTINQKNLEENILPYKNRARLILEKGADHAIERVWLRRL